MNQIRNRVYNLIFLLILISTFLIPTCSGTVFLKDGTEIPRDEVRNFMMNNSIYKTDSPFPIQFFYSSNCGSCKDALKFLQSYERKNPSTRIEYRNLVYNGENRQLFTEYKNQFRHPKISYPAVFIGNIGITGSSDIIHTTDQVVKGYQNQLY